MLALRCSPTFGSGITFHVRFVVDKRHIVFDKNTYRLLRTKVTGGRNPSSVEVARVPPVNLSNDNYVSIDECLAYHRGPVMITLIFSR